MSLQLLSPAVEMSYSNRRRETGWSLKIRNDFTHILIVCLLFISIHHLMVEGVLGAVNQRYQ